MPRPQPPNEISPEHKARLAMDILAMLQDAGLADVLAAVSAACDRKANPRDAVALGPWGDWARLTGCLAMMAEHQFHL